MKATTWQHANGNMLAIVDTETTGLRAGYHDMIQLAVLPVNANLDPMGIEPFNMLMKPSRPKNISWKAMKVNKITKDQIISAPQPEDAFFIFEHWFQKNVLDNGFKKILPIGQNLNFDRAFIEEWVGWDEVPGKDGKCDPEYNFSQEFFEWRKMRDTKLVAEYLNDLAWFNNEKFPFPKTSLGALASRFGIKKDGAHDALFDTMMTGKVYRRFCSLRINMLDFGAVDED